jgi:hypothetical protein
MQLTKQQKIVGAVLALAIGAFLVDRFVIGHESDAAPAVSARQPAARRLSQQTKPLAAQAAAAAPLPGNVATLAARLQDTARAQKLNLETVRDAFRPPAAWVGTSRPATVDDLQAAAAEFQKRKLTAIMRQSGGGVAIINEKAVSVGQSLDGFRLVAVKDRSAVLRRGNHKVELRLVEDGTSEKVAGLDPVR